MESHLLVNISLLPFSVLLPTVSPGNLLFIACLCVVANGCVCSSGTSAGNCIWLVSICTVGHIMFLSAVSISLLHEIPGLLNLVIFRLLG